MNWIINICRSVKRDKNDLEHALIEQLMEQQQQNQKQSEQIKMSIKQTYASWNISIDTNLFIESFEIRS